MGNEGEVRRWRKMGNMRQYRAVEGGKWGMRNRAGE